MSEAGELKVWDAGTYGQTIFTRSGGPFVAMAQEIGMDVISEGAETESDAVELAQIGCQFAQGAAFGQPMSAAAARKLMGATPG